MAPSPLSVVLSATSKQTRSPRNFPHPNTRYPASFDKILILHRLISSSIFGGTIFYATTQLPPAQAARVMFGVGVFLGLFFGIRFFRSFKVMPGGVMTVLRYQFPFQLSLMVVGMQFTSMEGSLGSFKGMSKWCLRN